MTETIKVALSIFAFVFCMFYLLLFIFATAELMDKRHKLKCPISNPRNVDTVFPVRGFACWLLKRG